MHTHAPWTLEDLSFCAPTTADVQRALALIARCETAEYGEPDTPLEDLALEWAQIDLARDAWLVATPAGDLVGYAALKRWREELECALFADPSWAGPDLGQALLERCLGRGRELAREQAAALMVRTYVAHANGRQLAIVAGAGFRPAKYHFQMGIRLDEPPPAPAWPAGVTVRTAVRGQDEPAIHALVEAAFARPGRTPTSLEEWSGLMLRPDLYDPDLWFLACAREAGAGETLVGVCLAFAYPAEGWVRQLAVDAGWRGKGLGRALLHHAFGVFFGQGYDRAGLAVDSENPNAYAFYQRIGMQRVRQYDEYVRAVPG